MVDRTNDSKSSLRHFFKQNLESLSSESTNSEDTRVHRSSLRKRDSDTSSTSGASSEGERSGSHLSLRRFLKKIIPDSDGHRVKHKEKKKRHSHHMHILPARESDLYDKYGKPGKLIGMGASGSVNLVTLKTDPTKIFAVKKFRSKLKNESDHDYKTKVRNEFKIGELLQHEHLIKTVELIKETKFGGTDYYMIMEYCRYDFFNLVMSGLMTEPEIFCYLKQIINGVKYMHSVGLAHRDLKLDNCVVNDKGVLKLIDFGSTVQFRRAEIPEADLKQYQFEELIQCDDKYYKLIRCKGIVGSDPYLAPEVFNSSTLGYDPRKVDYWSIAVIFCCMILRRFPWKLPQQSDESYKQFLKNREEKLLRLLPQQAVPFINNMLELDPQKRDIVDDDWYKQVLACNEEYKCNTHVHHLVSEDDLNKLQQEEQVAKQLKNTGIS